MFNGNAGLQVTGKFFGYLPGQPVLTGIRLQKTIGQQDQYQDPQQYAKKYFKRFPQGEFVYCKSRYSSSPRKCTNAKRKQIFREGETSRLFGRVGIVPVAESVDCPAGLVAVTNYSL